MNRSLQQSAITYEAAWPSLDRRPCPPWYDQAKFGVMIHWGVYSVPAWAPKRSEVNRAGEAYAEWYGSAIRSRIGPYWAFHRNLYGERVGYEELAASFRAEMFDPRRWADLFVRSGARYVTLTSKHHDGFCLWPSASSWNWNSADIGPRRDIVGELSEAVKQSGLRMGLYYSLMEWFRPSYAQNPRRYAREHMAPQLKELIVRYKPSLLFTDGEWEHPSELWESCGLLAWLFNESPVKDEIVVNDRWGSDTRSRHGGYYSTEYGEVDDHGTPLGVKRKWEECRGIGSSFGFNRNEGSEDYMNEHEAIHLLVDVVSRGGNLLLNVGPTADGTIPPIMEERLLQLGDWLRVNGEAIYGTTPCPQAPQREDMRFTRTDEAVYAICLKWPSQPLVLDNPEQGADYRDVRLLGGDGNVSFQCRDGKLHIEAPPLTPDRLPCRYAYVLKMRKREER